MLKKSTEEWKNVRFVGGPADGALTLSHEWPASGLLVYFKYGTVLKYQPYGNLMIRLRSHNPGTMQAKRINNTWMFRPEGLTHTYIYNDAFTAFTYAGLYPISNPLGLKTRKIDEGD